MDEISMVRRVVAEPQPLPRVVAEGRERVLAAAADEARTSTPPIKRSAFRSAIRLGLAAAAAALVLATLLPEADTTREGESPAAPEGSAQSALLAAAVVAESAPTSGTYWHVRTLFRTTWPRKLGRGDNRYTVEHLSVWEEWTKRGGQTWRGLREWAEPKTPKDVAAWRRDGRPNEWCRENTELAEPSCIRTAPGTASVWRMDDDQFLVGEEPGLTFAQLQHLPEDPDALRAWAVDLVKNALDKSASRDLVEYSVSGALADLLVDVPVPPGVRAAAYRALADMPNVESIGPTQDALGRAGVGILIEAGEWDGVLLPGGDRFEAGEATRRLMIDPSTSHVLADQVGVGESFDSSGGVLVLEVGWTAERPHKPELP
jgi:hypothetical protein